MANKIANGAVLGLDKALLASSDEFDDFVNKLKSRTFITPGEVQIITASRVITEQSIAEALDEMQ